MTLIYIVSAWLTGIGLAHALSLPWQAWLGLGLTSLIGLIGWRGSPHFRLVCACVLALALGGGRLLCSQPRLDERSVAAYNDAGPVMAEGVIVEEPDRRETHAFLRMRVDRLVLADGRQVDVDGLALVRAARYPEFAYGDRVRAFGPLETPPHGVDFSYRDYLARQGVYSLMPRARVRHVASGCGSPFYAALLAVKQRAHATIGAILHEPAASLLTGILLGVETGIPADLMDDFSATGTTHIIAISGFNITIVSGIFAGLSRRLVGPRHATWVAIAGVLVYTVFVGASAAVVRAALMGVIYLLGKHAGRDSFAPVSLAAAALVMTALNPYTLWDVGFQLSFAATVGLVLYTDALERRTVRFFARFTSAGRAEQVVGWLSEALLVTTAAQITTLPLTLYYFRRLSLVTLLTNLLILPAQSMVMVVGGLATLAGLAWLPAGWVLGWVAWLPLIYTIEAVRLTARVPYASVAVGRVDGWGLAVFYALLAGLTWWSRQSPERRSGARLRARAVWASLTARLSDRAMLGASALLLVLAGLAWRALPDGRLHVVFFDLGPGDATLIRTPSGRQVLVDGGPSPSLLLDRLGRQMGFWDHHLDLIVLSHPDEDLLPGLIAVVERYRVGGVIAHPVECLTPLCTRWEEALAESGAQLWRGEAGLRVELDEGLLLTVLYPGPEVERGTPLNDASLVVRIDYGQVCFLLPGDASGAVEEQLVDGGAWLDCTVLKAAHHGDGNATGEAFLQAVRPQAVVIPVDEGNRFGYPHRQLLDRLSGLRVYRTDRNGTVVVTSDGRTFEVQVER